MGKETESRSPVNFDTTSSTTPEDSGGGLLPIALGVVGVLAGLAAIGLVFYKTAPDPEADKPLQALRTQVDGLSNQVEQLQRELQAVNKSAGEIEKVRSDLQSLTRSAQQNLNELGQAIMKNRERIQSQGESLVEIVDRMQKLRQPAAPTPTVTDPAQSPPEDESTGASGSDGQIVHTIRPGDSFARLAKEYGVSMFKIQDANPGVDPLRLQIGQKIVIPSE